MKKTLINIFKGNLSLPKTFWLIYILGSFLTSIPIILGDIYYNSLNEFLSATVLLFLLINISYFIYSTISTWNSATNYISKKKKDKKNSFWGYAAKVMVVILILRAIGTTLSSLLT